MVKIGKNGKKWLEWPKKSAMVKIVKNGQNDRNWSKLVKMVRNGTAFLGSQSSHDVFRGQILTVKI